MKHFPAFDPPEYVSWSLDPQVLAEFRARLEADPERRKLISGLDRAKLLKLHRGLVRFRLHDVMLKRWVRRGIISKAWLGTGEEAVTIGSVHALEPGDAAGPMIRNAGVCHEMGMPIADMLRGYLGTLDGPTAGKDLHVGDLSKGIVTPISHVGSLVPVCAGIALAFKTKKEPKVAITYVGDGAVRTAEFHEGMNFASVARLPFVAVVQNNGVALGTLLTAHTVASLRDAGRAYGVPAFVCDGNNVLDVWAASRLAVDRARRGEGASIVVAETFRMGGHATHDEAEARRLFPPAVFEHWGRREPISVFEEWLVADAGVARAELTAAEAEVEAEVEQASEEALASRESAMPRGPEALLGVYAS